MNTVPSYFVIREGEAIERRPIAIHSRKMGLQLRTRNKNNFF